MVCSMLKQWANPIWFSNHHVYLVLEYIVSISNLYPYDTPLIVGLLAHYTSYHIIIFKLHHQLDAPSLAKVMRPIRDVHHLIMICHDTIDIALYGWLYITSFPCNPRHRWNMVKHGETPPPPIIGFMASETRDEVVDMFWGLLKRFS